MGKKKFDFTHGVDRKRSLKKKRLGEKVEKVYIWNDFHKMGKPEMFLKQHNATKDVPLEKKIFSADEIEVKAIYLFYSKLMYSENWYIWLIFLI